MTSKQPWVHPLIEGLLNLPRLGPMRRDVKCPWCNKSTFDIKDGDVLGIIDDVMNPQFEKDIDVVGGLALLPHTSVCLYLEYRSEAYNES